VVDDPVLGQVPNITQKTLRWPGFAGNIVTLATLGLLDERPVAVNGVSVAPRTVVDAVLAPHVSRQPGDHDVTVLIVEARGELGGVSTMSRIHLLDRADPSTGLTSMARVTGFTLAFSALALARGAVSPTGWCQPQSVLAGDLGDELVDHLERRGATIRAATFRLPHATQYARGTGG
jgi:lysine 6-dehydrogenase